VSVKERLTGAIILVALIVLLVPELLTGPIRTKSVPAASSTQAEAPLRSYTLTLSAPRPADAAPATPAAQTPTQPAQDSSAERSAHTPADGAAEGSGTRHAPVPAAATVQAGAPRVSRQSAAGDPGLQGASSPAHPPVREVRVAASGGGWVVQLGSFASRQNANRLAHSLTARGFRASVSPARAGSRVLWRVRVGPAHDRAGAQRLAVRLRALGHRGELLPVR
jgi:DedD protein